MVDNPKIFVSVDRKEPISLTKDELQAGIDSGKYKRATLAWVEGLPKWLPLSNEYWAKLNIKIPEKSTPPPPLPPLDEKPPVEETKDEPENKGDVGDLGCIFVLVWGVLLVILIAYGIRHYNKPPSKTGKQIVEERIRHDKVPITTERYDRKTSSGCLDCGSTRGFKMIRTGFPPQHHYECKSCRAIK
jgi:hypothetical protein